MPFPFPATLFSSATFSPTSIAGLAMWYDASDGASITQVGGAISQWSDKSGNGKHATQSTGSKQPTVQTAAQNGLNTVRFTAASAQVLNFTATTFTKNTIIAVVRRGGPAGANDVELLGNSGSPASIALEWYSADTVIYGALNGFAVTSTAQAATGYHIVTVANNAALTGNFIRFDRADITSTQAAHANTATYDSLGFSDNIFSNCEMAEVLVYDSVLNSSNYGDVEGYLKAKWGTP